MDSLILFQAHGFFRGLGFPLASYGVVNSVFFGMYGSTLKYLKGSDNRKSSYREVYIAGCVGGFAQLFVACPVDVVKVVLQSQMSKSAGTWCKTCFQAMYILCFVVYIYLCVCFEQLMKI